MLNPLKFFRKSRTPSKHRQSIDPIVIKMDRKMRRRLKGVRHASREIEKLNAQYEASHKAS